MFSCTSLFHHLIFFPRFICPNNSSPGCLRSSIIVSQSCDRSLALCCVFLLPSSVKLIPEAWLPNFHQFYMSILVGSLAVALLLITGCVNGLCWLVTLSSIITLRFLLCHCGRCFCTICNQFATLLLHSCSLPCVSQPSQRMCSPLSCCDSLQQSVDVSSFDSLARPYFPTVSSFRSCSFHIGHSSKLLESYPFLPVWYISQLFLCFLQVRSDTLILPTSYLGNGQIRRHIGDANLAGEINGIFCCFGGNTDK